MSREEIMSKLVNDKGVINVDAEVKKPEQLTKE